MSIFFFISHPMVERRGCQEMRGEQIRNDKNQRFPAGPQTRDAQVHGRCCNPSGNTLVSRCVEEIINEDVFSRPEGGSRSQPGWVLTRLLCPGVSRTADHAATQRTKSTLTGRRGCQCLIEGWFLTLNPVLHYVTTNFADCQLMSYE